MQQILVGVDGSENGAAALRWAVAEAKLRGAKLTALHAWHIAYPVSPYPMAAMAYDVELMQKSAAIVLDEAIASVDVSGLAAPVARLVVEGSASQAMLKAAAETDLIVVGARGHGGFVGLLIGSVATQIAHHARCAVVIVPGPSAEQVKQVATGAAH